MNLKKHIVNICFWRYGARMDRYTTQTIRPRRLANPAARAGAREA